MSNPAHRAIRANAALERGSGTVIGLALVMVLLLLLIAVLVLAEAAVAAGRAATAADLSALAGADAARGLSSGAPCAVAATVAARQEAVLTRCRVGGHHGEIIDVWTSVDLASPWGSAVGRSRAGPPP